MGLFKTRHERRVERDIKVRQGIRRIEKSIREQTNFQNDFVASARQAKAAGNGAQYDFVRGSLKRTATIRKMLERQLMCIKNALLVKRQAEAASDFASSMDVMSTEISRLFGETDLTRTQAAWEKAMAQSQSMEERMGIFLDNIEGMAAQDAENSSGETTSDAEIDAMIEAEERAEKQQEVNRNTALRAELDALDGEKTATK